MSFTTKAAVFAAGYAVGHPEGRRLVVQLRDKAIELSRRPQVKQARERAWDIAGDQALAVKNRVTSRSRSTQDQSASETDSHRSHPDPTRTGRHSDPAVDTAAAGTAAAADGLQVTPAASEPVPPVPPARP
jgi:hypothetical protein